MGKHRIRIEQVNSKLKIFNFFATPYRNRCKGIDLGMNLITAIYST